MAFRVSSSVKIPKWNAELLKARIPAILRQYDKVLFPAFQEQIKLVRYNWPNRTYRKNGTIEDSPRDIYDLGNFYRSQLRVPVGPNALSLTYQWGGPKAPYAPLIFNGYITSTGAQMPARNWIKPALEENPLREFVILNWRRYQASTNRA